MSSAMINSGIPWIGEIPSHWRKELIGSCIKEVNNPNTENAEDNALQFKMGTIISKKGGDSKYNPETLEAYNMVRQGDIIINGLNLSFDFISQRVGLVKEDGVITSTYLALRPLPFIDSRFLNYLFKGYDYCKALHSMGRGLRATLGYNEFRKYFVVFPSLPEQQALADFLDIKCSEIDAMITLQLSIIEELKAYKQSVITEVVSKGLNSDVTMKDSGIEWIGEIPEGWNIVQIRRIVLSHLQGYYDADGYVTAGYRLLRITDLVGNGDISLSAAPYVKETPQIKDFLLKKGDFCFARTGGAGTFGFVSGDIEPAVYASYLIRFRFIGQNNNFLRYYFLSHCFISEIHSLIHGGVNKNIHADNIKDTHIVLPPLSEQQAIAEYLDTRCREIDALISLKQFKIDALKEYKKSIIYEYITGKKEING